MTSIIQYDIYVELVIITTLLHTVAMNGVKSYTSIYHCINPEDGRAGHLWSSGMARFCNFYPHHLASRNRPSTYSTWLRRIEISRLINTFTGFIKSNRQVDEAVSTPDWLFSNYYSPRMPSTTTSLATYLIIDLIWADSGFCTLILPILYRTYYIFTPFAVISLQK